MPFTPVWGTGFGAGAIPLRAGVCSVTGTTGITTSNVHIGPYAASVGSSLFPGGIVITLGSVLSVSFGAWCKQGNGYLEIIVTLTDNSQVRLIMNTGNSTWDYKVGNDVIAAGNKIANLTSYHYVEAIFSSAQVQTRIDGNLDITAAGVLQNIKSVSFAGYGNAGGQGGYYDDISVGSGSFPGDIRYDPMVPVGDTEVHDWLPSGVSLQAPPAAPTLGLSAGPGLTGDYRYRITIVDGDGETLGGTISALVQPSNQTVNLTAIPTGLSGTSARKIYRTAAGGSVYKLVATLNDNSTTTYNDTVADGSLGANEPTNIHYDKLDEVPPNDSDYIYVATNGAKDVHTYSDWDDTKKIPLYLVHWERIKKDTADTQQVKLLLKSGVSSTLVTSPAHEVLTSEAYEYELHTTDPDGAAWTNAEIDALQAGVEAVI